MLERVDARESDGGGQISRKLLSSSDLIEVGGARGFLAGVLVGEMCCCVTIRLTPESFNSTLCCFALRLSDSLLRLVLKELLFPIVAQVYSTLFCSIVEK